MPTCPHCSFTVDKNAKVCQWCDQPLNVEYTATKDPTGAVVAGSSQVSALVRRYKDAYLVAGATDGFGKFIKIIGVVIAALLVLLGAVVMGEAKRSSSFGSDLASAGPDGTTILGVATIVAGLVLGLFFYIVGVLVSTQGQILKASLDGAVNGSPFLSNEHKARIMSLPES